MNRRGDVPTILLFLIAIFFSVVALFSFLTFSGSYGERSADLSKLMSELDFAQNYVVEMSELIAEEHISTGKSIKEISIERDIGYSGAGNFFGKLRNGDFTFNNSVLEVKGVFVKSSSNGNSAVRRFDLTLEFGLDGELVDRELDYGFSDTDFSKEIFSLEFGESYVFDFGGEKHRITFVDSNENSYDFLIASEPVLISLIIGETKKIDLDGDGFYDVQVTLVSVDPNTGEPILKRQEIHEKISERNIEERKNKIYEIELLNNPDLEKLSVEQLAESIVEKVVEERYSGIIIGENHGMSRDRDFVFNLLGSLSVKKKILFYEEPSIMFTNGNLITRGLFTMHRDSENKIPNLVEKSFILRDQFNPCPDLENPIRVLNDDEVIILYVGDFHTTKKPINIFENYAHRSSQGNVETVKDCFEKNGKKTIVISYKDFNVVSNEDYQEFFITEFLNSKEKNLEDLLDVSGSWNDKIQNLRKGVYFVEYFPDHYFGSNFGYDEFDYSPEVINTFIVVWKDERIRNIVINNGLSFKYISLREIVNYGKRRAVFLSNENGDKYIKIYLREDASGNLVIDGESRSGLDL